MKVLQLLEELEEIVQGASKVPLTGKSLLDAEDLMEIIKEIRVELPEELQRAQSEAMIDRDEITNQARIKAEEIISNADMQSRNLKMRTYEYIDNVMNSMIERVEYANRVYMKDMYENLKKSFDQVTETLTDNKAEINNLAYQESVKSNARDSLDENFMPIEEEEYYDEEE